MKYYLAFLSILVLMMACSSGAKQSNTRELVPNPEKYQHDVFAGDKNAKELAFKPDTKIGDIVLLNIMNVTHYLGPKSMDLLEEGGLPHAVYRSKNDLQELTVYFHPGSLKNEFAEFEVAYAKEDRRKKTKLADRAFKTESAIKLGMTMGDFNAIKGKADSLSVGETTVLHYRITDLSQSDFLKKYNMPEYYADYEFANGYLVRFRFGFYYP